MSKFPYHSLARVVLSAETPIRIGSGAGFIDTYAQVTLDANGLPYIPGSSLAGVLRHLMNDDSLFGSAECRTGSEIIVSDACLVYEDGVIAEGIITTMTPFLSSFVSLPVRNHVRINHKGASADKGKFGEQVVFKGCRFCFELELSSSSDCSDKMRSVLECLFESGFRIGGGTRRGFGQMKVHSIRLASLCLKEPVEREMYFGKTSSLNDLFWEKYDEWSPAKNTRQEFVCYKLDLKPEDFFLFGSGLRDNDVDITPVQETVVMWEGDTPSFAQDYYLVPASSIKGALAHRVAFHYNRLKGVWADDCRDNIEKYTGPNNEAVATLFGNSGASENSKPGSVYLTDLFFSAPTQTLHHVTIDGLTGGAKDGHLFGEKVSVVGDSLKGFSLDILVDKKALGNKNIKQALEFALNDLCEGRLPLGGRVNRGHGTFTGNYEVIDYEQKD